MGGEPMPAEKSWTHRMWSRLDEYMVYFGLPLMLVIGISFLVWMMCCQEPPSEENIAKRKAFEEKLRVGEEMLARKREDKKRRERGEAPLSSEPAAVTAPAEGQPSA